MNCAIDTKLSYVYLVSSDSTKAFLCPFKTFQYINHIYSANPSAYKIRRDFVEMETAFETHGKVEMLDGIIVSRYPLVL
jgi:hypothetical protein